MERPISRFRLLPRSRVVGSVHTLGRARLPHFRHIEGMEATAALRPRGDARDRRGFNMAEAVFGASAAGRTAQVQLRRPWDHCREGAHRAVLQEENKAQV